MAHSELLATVRRPLSPDTQIEVPATRSEYERVQEILEEEDAKFPTLQYDGFRKVAIVRAAPSPLHGDMVGQLLGRISRSVERMPKIEQNIKDGVSISSDSRNTRDTGDTSTTRNWDGALKYLTEEGEVLMVAVEVGVSQIYASLRAAVSFSVCALRCRVGIAMCISERDRGTAPTIRYYATREEKRAAIQEVERILRAQLQAHPFGPLETGEDTWFGEVANVVLETYRLEDETSPPETLLNPTQSFTLVEDGRFVGGEVPPNLAEITLGDCIPTHILTGNNIEATPVNFFHQDWFENTFRFAMLRTAMERVEDKSKEQRDVCCHYH
ncbi:hypothetical protein POJ06DRAFT_190968 [Lipomyces tetrasporus]|uniref:Uncharacterized protein n=1 Tax=Lipomyces tetrasporus TaxID=54092 RepID=A0AAD7VVJ2_9ASCO|nr:uncharacterized protein POJ06DRAFT_190968 [Lipomyces tetrasporus]KAJ8103553.1 hypothetical protein POJ06DRAFT_190968 [Lipomyces tetrasporus]